MAPWPSHGATYTAQPAKTETALFENEVNKTHIKNICSNFSYIGFSFLKIRNLGLGLKIYFDYITDVKRKFNAMKTCGGVQV
jgi:hypothetical protein